MIDPVSVASGLTYDRAAIEEWIGKGNRTCPKTKQQLAHIVLTPNLLVEEMILKWLKENAIWRPSTAEACEKQILLNLLAKLSSSDIDLQKKAAKEIRERTKDSQITKSVFGKIQDAIPQMIRALSVHNDPFGNTSEAIPTMAEALSVLDYDLEVEEDSITALLNISMFESNKKLFADHSEAIPAIIRSLESENAQTRCNAAATLFSLSGLESNKQVIGLSGAVKLLIELLGEGDALVIKDAAEALFSLCILRENRTRAVADGAVPVIVQKIRNKTLVGELLSLLALLCSQGDGVKEMVEADAVPLLLKIMKSRKSEPLNKENALAIIYSICSVDSQQLRIVDRNELKNTTLKDLFQHGTPKAKEKAHALLQTLFATTS